MNSYFQNNFHFCPRCGSKISLKETYLNCQQCGFQLYPNPAPTTAVFIVKENQVLLAKRGIKPKKGMWDTPGGFVEPEESLKQGAIREIQEEVGVKVKIMDMIGSYPDQYQGKPTINIGFVGEIISGKIKASDDVASLHWFHLNQTPKQFGFESVAKLLFDLKRNI